jgi:hypothetical protein
VFSGGTPFPPPQRLGGDGVAVWWFSTSRQARVEANAHIDGKPARIMVKSEPARPGPQSVVVCAGTGATQRFLSAQIEGPSSTVRQIRVGAVICGPDFAGGEADVRQMLASLHFTP